MLFTFVAGVVLFASAKATGVPPYLVLWDADSPAPIDTLDNLGGVIDLCLYGSMNLNLEVIYEDLDLEKFEYVKMTLTDVDTGTELLTQYEGVAPYMLGGDINSPFSVNTLPELKTPGSYELVANFKKGPKATLYFSIEECGPTTSPTAFPTLPAEEQDDLVTCISVIDENDDDFVDGLWATLRETWPDRPFCLLRPVPASWGLSIPTDFFADPINIYSEVTRNPADVANPSDWYNICNLEAGKSAGLTNVVLFIDNSGSLITSDVATSLELFLNQTTENGFTIVDAVENGSEDYISPCLLRSLVA